MVKQRKIVGIWPAPAADEPPPAQDEPLELTAEAMVPTAEPAEAEPLAVAGGIDARGWIDDEEISGALYPDMDAGHEKRLPWTGILLAALAAAWIFAVAWTATGAASRIPTAGDAIQWIAITATPLALLLVLWMALERGSHASTVRHLRLLAELRDEQHRLDERLSAIDGQWAAAQTALLQRAAAAQAAIGSSVGAIEAAASALDGKLQQSVSAAGLVAQQTDAAARQLHGLSVALPKSEDVAKRVAEILQGAAHSAYQQGARLEEQLAAVQSDTGDVEQRIEAALTALDGRLAEVRVLASQADDAAQAASARFASALEAQRVEALAMLADLAANLETSSDAVEARLSAARTRIVETIAAQLAALDAGIAKVGAGGEEIDASIGRAAERSEALAAALTEAVAAIETRLSQFSLTTGERLSVLTEAVQAASQDVERLSGSGERNAETVAQMIERIESARAQFAGLEAQIDEVVPQSLATLDSHIERVRAAIGALPGLVEQGSEGAAAMLARIAEAERLLEQQAEQMTALDAGSRGMLAERAGALASLRETVEGLSASIAALEQDRLPSLDARIAESVAASATTVERVIGSAVDAALGATAEARIEQVSTQADQAVAAATAAAEQLTQRLAELNEASAAVEARQGAFAQSIQRHDSEALARQMALTSEALQAMSVDMARVLDSEISDQAWQAWLKGDRSVFARRTVRLLTSTEARDVHRRYGEDEAFRALVNRYIHDFEAMLRRMVDAPEGDALTVTLLSSDIGKIYVALAQAIERLRN